MPFLCGFVRALVCMCFTNEPRGLMAQAEKRALERVASEGLFRVVRTGAWARVGGTTKDNIKVPLNEIWV